MNFRSFTKSKGSNSSTGVARNPLNSHIFEKFSKLKSLAEARGFKNQSFCYYKILKCLSKYPLPILSAFQVIELEGIGDKTAHLIIKLLKKEYEGNFVDNNEGTNSQSQLLEKEIAKDSDLEGEPDLEENEKNIDQNNEEKTSQNPENENSQLFFEEFKMRKPLISLNKRTVSEANAAELEPLRKKLLVQTESTKSSKTSSKYKMPDPDSTTSTILISLLAFQSQQNGKYASRKEIKKVSEELTVKCAEISNWSGLKTLLKHDILFKFEFDGVEKYCLSQEGEKIGEKLLDYQMKIMERTQSSKENSRGFELQGSAQLERKKQSTKKLQPIDEKNSSEEKTNQKKKEIIENKHEILVENIETFNVVLVVDNREVKNQEDRNYIYNKLVENGIDCELGSLPLGDFLWIARVKEKNQNEIKLFMLDYIIERKKADDLSSSIIDGRYLSQKARLKKSRIANAIWLIEGKPSQNSTLSQNVLDSAVFHLQFLYDFKVQRTESLQKTLNWLSHMTLAIQKKITLKIRSKEPLKFQMTLEDFLLNNTKTTNTIGDIFKNMLTNINNCGQKACDSIFQKFKTPRRMYEGLMSLGDHEERIGLLCLKARKANKKSEKLGEEADLGINVRMSLAKKLVILFCEQSYPEVIAESNEEDFNDEL